MPSQTPMYHQHFGLNEPPFSIAVNPRYLFMSPRHRDALAHLLYGVSSGGGFILLTGEVGTGKTTVNRCLLEQLPDTTDVAIILNPALSAVELLASACDELGIDYPTENATLKQLTDALHRFLLKNHERGRKTVLMIDEAQHLDFDVLEQIRLLTNLETHDEKLLQIILIGQPELSDKLARPELRQLNQRITARYHLEPLNAEETGAYIRHRLEVAGLTRSDSPFSAGVVRDIHRRTRGIPRLINLLCDRALLGAYGQRRAAVNRQLVGQAAVEVLGSQERRQLRRLQWLLLLPLLLLLAALLWWLPTGPSVVSEPDDLTNETPAAVQIEPSPAPESASSNAPWLMPEQEAASLMWQLASDDPIPASGCPDVPIGGVLCSRVQVETWELLAELDRPVMLTMRSPDRFAAATVVLAMAAEHAWVVVDGRPSQVPLAQLASAWTGDVRYLWQVPSGWSGSISRGDSGVSVAAVASMFAALDGQQRPLTNGSFNAALEQRVQLFQRGQGLVDDGVVGEQTLLRLNRELATALDSERAERRLRLLSGD